MHTSPAMEAAWQAYRQGIEDVREIIFSHPFAEDPRTRNEAHYLFHQLQAEAFQAAIAPKPDYPRFYPIFEPLTFSWGIPCPDFLYSRLYLDGRRTYRIRGQRSNSLFVAIQSINAHFTLPPERMKLLGDFDLDKFHIFDDGGFEIILSATPHAGNWIPLDPDSTRNFILVREAICDWEGQQRCEMDIEPIDDLPPGPLAYDEAEMIDRLQGAVRFMMAIAATLTFKPAADAIALAGGENRFAVQSFAGAAATSSAATFNLMAFAVGSDEALIIEIDPPEARFWNIQLGDSWNQALDYTYHQTSLNMTQVVADDDGRVRIVIAHRDPGVRNWLNPVDSRAGVVMLRWYFAERQAAPSARLVRFGEIDESLPATIARVTTQERYALLRRRRRAVAARQHLRLGAAA